MPSSAYERQELSSFPCSASEQVHKEPWESTARRAEPNWPREYSIVWEVMQYINCRIWPESWLKITVKGWAGHQSESNEQLSCVSLVSLICYFSLSLLFITINVIITFNSVTIISITYFTLFQSLDRSYLNPFFSSRFFAPCHWDTNGCAVFSCQLESSYDKDVGLQDVPVVGKAAVCVHTYTHA